MDEIKAYGTGLEVIDAVKPSMAATLGVYRAPETRCIRPHKSRTLLAPVSCFNKRPLRSEADFHDRAEGVAPLILSKGWLLLWVSLVEEIAILLSFVGILDRVGSGVSDFRSCCKNRQAVVSLRQYILLPRQSSQARGTHRLQGINSQVQLEPTGGMLCVTTFHGLFHIGPVIDCARGEKEEDYFQRALATPFTRLIAPHLGLKGLRKHYLMIVAGSAPAAAISDPPSGVQDILCHRPGPHLAKKSPIRLAKTPSARLRRATKAGQDNSAPRLSGFFPSKSRSIPSASTAFKLANNLLLPTGHPGSYTQISITMKFINILSYTVLLAATGLAAPTPDDGNVFDALNDVIQNTCAEPRDASSNPNCWGDSYHECVSLQDQAVCVAQCWEQPPGECSTGCTTQVQKDCDLYCSTMTNCDECKGVYERQGYDEENQEELCGPDGANFCGCVPF
ncbi:hypothetical protein FE257_008637 [Aspergillus nanangensis]|uniref:Uncharacterized protein n=1 Tax=Aspergillus nanangensis TaxID=2582783 RepID=A0AAD4CL32_ASPNN|nr:hypothetical protein FE257_008637 [Aspergillus nanangensis]